MQEGGIANLQGLYCDDDIATFSDCMDYYFGQDNDVEIKPILRPLSDLTKEINHDKQVFRPIDTLDMTFLDFEYFHSNEGLDLSKVTYLDAIRLLSWHFDIFGLISEGLAIDLNTVK